MNSVTVLTIRERIAGGGKLSYRVQGRTDEC
jgi:hypothetical protein